MINQLGNANLTIRMLAMNELTDRIGPAAIQPVASMMRKRQSTVFQRIHGLWVLHRFGALDPNLLAAATHDPDRALRVHAMKVLSETETLTPGQHALAVAGLRDADPLVERASGGCIGLPSAI